MKHRAKSAPLRFSKISLDGLVYQTRWLLYPVIMGLTVAAAVYLLRFLWEISLLIRHASNYIFSTAPDNTNLLLVSVDMLETLSIMVLLIHSIMGTHQIYIRPFKKRKNGPQWLDHIDTVTQKMKLGLAFASVSCALILKDLFASDHVTHEQWMRHIVGHGIFLATTLAAAMVWRLMHPSHNKKA
jgi:uncharacterized protein (TIGR00645 family)